MINTNNVKEHIESFLESWDRSEWMRDHGRYASETWNDEREVYAEHQRELTDAVQYLAEKISKLPSAEFVGSFFDVKHIEGHLKDIEESLQALSKAAQLLDDQVRPDEFDYIEEGTIDPDAVKDTAIDLDIGSKSQGWDCIEGWAAYRVGTSLYIRCYREAWGNRRDRDLWVLVSKDYWSST
jgi:hypothetical protein